MDVVLKLVEKMFECKFLDQLECFSCEEVEVVVCILFVWIGDDLECEGLFDMLKCVVKVMI